MKNLGAETEEAIMRALAHEVDGEMKQLPITKQWVNVITLVRAERERYEPNQGWAVNNQTK